MTMHRDTELVFRPRPYIFNSLIWDVERMIRCEGRPLEGQSHQTGMSINWLLRAVAVFLDTP